MVSSSEPTEDEDTIHQTSTEKLAELLSRASLPGLTNSQQMQLVVILQTYQDYGKGKDSANRAVGSSTSTAASALDPPALRYLVQVCMYCRCTLGAIF